MNNRARQVGYWAGWVLISEITGLIAFGLSAEVPPFLVGVIPSGDEANETGYSVGWAVILAGLLAGATIGGFEWLYLKRQFAGKLSGWWWTGVSALAFGASFTLAWAVGGGIFGSDFAHHGLPHAVDRMGVWGGLLIGGTLGTAQWLLVQASQLETKSQAKKFWNWWWVPANLLGFGAGWWIAAILSARFESAFGPMNHFWGGAVFGTVFGGITGLVVANFASGRKTRRPLVTGK